MVSSVDAFSAAMDNTGHVPLDIIDMGSQTFLSGALGRSMSPVAGAAIVCATLASVNPIEITKRNGVGMVLAALVTMFILM